jgi:signal transduction histidine kinase
MKLRFHLVVLVLAAVLPILLITAVMGVVFWRQQSGAYDERHLERVRALALALDRELDGHARALLVLAQSLALQRVDVETFYSQAQHVKRQHPAWTTLALVEPNGHQVLNLRRPLGTALPRIALDDAFVAAITASGRPTASPLTRGALSDEPMTYMIVPVYRFGRVSHLLVAALEPKVWLDLLSRHSTVPGATLTLLDQRGVIIARTLHHERWVGQLPSVGLQENVRKAPEMAARNVGLEGVSFYSAHTGVPFARWTLASGVPAAVVEQGLRRTAATLAAAAIVMLGVAVTVALLYGRRIAQPVGELARSVVRFGAGEPPIPINHAAVAEVAEVARAFDEAARRLSAREAMLRELATERAELLEREREARAEAEAANRTKDEFLAVLSNELRTPINAVFGWARMLRDKPVEPEALTRGLEVIERNAAAQVRLIEDLLDVSRIVTGKMRLDVQPVNVAISVEAALESVRHAAQAREIELEAELDHRAGVVSGDPDRLRQVVWNLLSNAIKFTPRAGRVHVRLAREGTRIVITVSDTGPGIAAELLPHVFERFRQGDSTSTRQQAGLGLGLALVKHIVELHGGDVRADNGESGGARVTVDLPMSLAPRPDTAMPVGGDGPSPGAGADSLSGIRVLLVDDDRDTVELFTRVLSAHGAEIQSATSAPDALGLMARWRPDVLISDVEMPGEDGYALIERVRALGTDAGGDVPAVAVTAYGRVEDRVRLLAAGYTMHVAKPVEPAELVTVLAVPGRRPAGRA